MEKKNNVLILGGVVLLLAVIAILVATMSKPSVNVRDIDLNSAEPITNEVVAPADSLLNAEQNTEQTTEQTGEETGEQEEAMVRDYTEADLQGLDLMTDSEKTLLNISSDLPVKVLERDANGTPTFFRFIESKADILAQ